MVRVAREVLVDEALVVADVEIGLGAVLGHEHLAVLERAHRPGVDVDVRIELLHLHAQAARLEQAAERRRGDALPERRDDPAGDEDVLVGVTRAARGGRACSRPGVRSISAPRERRSPRRVSPASAPIASHRLRPVSRLTELKPSIAPSAFDPASPSITLSRRSYGSRKTALRAGAPTSERAGEVGLQRTARARVELVHEVRAEPDEERAREPARGEQTDERDADELEHAGRAPRPHVTPESSLRARPEVVREADRGDRGNCGIAAKCEHPTDDGSAGPGG